MRHREIINEKSRSEWLSLIKEWIHNEEDRRILERYLLDGLSVEAVAEEYNLSTVRMQTRISKAKTQLFRHLR